MNTVFLVMAEFNSSEIPLEKVCDQFGMKLDQAKRKAAGHELPVPFYKKSGKSGYFCSVTEWAAYLDQQQQAARAEWEKMNGQQRRAS